MLEEKQDGTQVQVKSIEVSSIVSVLESLKKSSVCEVAKELRVQVPGFRLNKAPKKRIIEGIAHRMQFRPIHEVLDIVFCRIFTEYPELYDALSDEEKEFDLDYFVDLCGADIVGLCLALSDNAKHKELLELLIERKKEDAKRTDTSKKAVKKEPASDKHKKDEVSATHAELERLKKEVKSLKSTVAEKDRLISAKSKEIKKLERKLDQERSQGGRRANELGSLRKENASLRRQLTLSDQEKESYLNRIDALNEEIKAQRKDIESVSRTAALREEQTLSYQDQLEKLFSDKRRLFLDAIKWQSKWQIESLLRTRSSESREVEMEVLIGPKDLQEAYLGAVRRAENRLVESFLTQGLSSRKELLEQIKMFISLEDLVEKTPLHDEAMLPINIKIEPQKSIEHVAVEGMFIYEGPHGYLKTDEGLLLIAPYDIAVNNLVTGDRIRLILDRSFAGDMDVDVRIEILEKVESKETVCSLKKEGDEIAVLNPYHYELELSQSEIEYVGCSLDNPVTVVYPDVKMARIPQNLTVYARILRAHDHTWQEPPARERKRSEKRRATGKGEETGVEPLFAGRTVLVVGGETMKEQLRSIVESMKGEFLFQPGFDCKGTVEGNVKKADFVVCVTQDLSHSVQKLVLKAADKHQVPYFYYNDRGAARFREFLGDLNLPN